MTQRQLDAMALGDLSTEDFERASAPVVIFIILRSLDPVVPVLPERATRLA